MPFDPQRSPWSHEGGFRADFRERIRELDGDLVAIGRAVVALAEPVRDLAATPTDAVAVRAGLHVLEVQAAGVRLEDAAFTLVALESPVAEDLREIVAIIRGVYDIVRSGRLAQHVIEQLAVLEACPQCSTTTGPLGRMRGLAADLFADSIDAWADRDALAHNELHDRDRAVDDLHDRIQEGEDPCSRHDCIAARVLCVRFLERYADHGVALAAHLSWAITGDRVLDAAAQRS